MAHRRDRVGLISPNERLIVWIGARTNIAQNTSLAKKEERKMAAIPRGEQSR